MIGERIDYKQAKKLRQRLGITGKRASLLLNMPQKTVTGWEVSTPRSSRTAPGIVLAYYNLLDVVVNELGVPLETIEKVLQERLSPPTD